jgi:hypothetical protein
MLDWPRLALAIIQMLSSLVEWIKGESLREEGREEVAGRINTEALNALTRANKAREDAAARNHAVPESDSLPDDGFRRD